MEFFQGYRQEPLNVRVLGRLAMCRQDWDEHQARIVAGLLVRHNSKSEQPLKRLKIGAKSELLQGGSLKRLKIRAKSELLQGGGE